ncbi:MAG: DegT/DnrJ/EryC1/StrS family aminotransferase [Elusimicrobia bacterium]|nr:DegT/DnrJ/EryC1/StrS family aminotransferase [Elusimicrobiota bacterium]
MLRAPTARAKLALFGGTPVRKKPFSGPAVFDASERKNVLEVLQDKALSRFMGSPSADIDKQLAIPSAAAARYNPQHFMFIGGRKVRALEAEFAARFGAKYAVAVNSATSGLMTALGACRLGPGDEVITTCLSFNATAVSILAFNSIPVFADVDPETFCMDPEDVRRKITPHTKAILVVHLLGRAANMDAILGIARERGLMVIEDCSQSPGTLYHGKPVGTLSPIGVFSLQDTKNIVSGEGGVIITSDPDLARRCRLIRNHGESIPGPEAGPEELCNLVGFNFRMTELTAAVALAQVKKLKANNQQRNVNARYLAQRLAKLPYLRVCEGFASDGNVCHVLPMLYDAESAGASRDAVLAALRAEGIPTGTGYPRLMPENPIFTKKIAFGSQGWPWEPFEHGRARVYRREDYPVAASLIYEKFIWFYHVNAPNTPKDMEDAAKAFQKVFSNLEALREYTPSGPKVYKW